MISKIIGVTALAVTLAACGTGNTERTTGGAAAGAATGAGVGALGGPPGALAGAAIGAGAGAATGASTSSDQVNLGAPPWSNPQARVPGMNSGGSSSSGSVATAGPADREAAAWAGGVTDPQQVRTAQRELRQRGYNVGPIDGIYGPRTRDAVANFQRSNNIRETSRLTSETMQLLTSRAGPSPTAQGGNYRGPASGDTGAPGSDAVTGAGAGVTGSGGPLQPNAQAPSPPTPSR